MYKMTVLSSFTKIKPHFHAVDYFKELPFYNKPIEIKKVKRLKNIDRLAELPFYEQLNVIKTNQAFRVCEMYKVEIIERKVLIMKSKICYTTKSIFIFINKLSFHTGNIVKLQ